MNYVIKNFSMKKKLLPDDFAFCERKSYGKQFLILYLLFLYRCLVRAFHLYPSLYPSQPNLADLDGESSPNCIKVAETEAQILTLTINWELSRPIDMLFSKVHKGMRYWINLRDNSWIYFSSITLGNACEKLIAGGDKCSAQILAPKAKHISHSCNYVSKPFPIRAKLLVKIVWYDIWVLSIFFSYKIP